MQQFIDRIYSKRDPISKRYAEEIMEFRRVALAAALLHDIGHGAFSHALEKTTKIKHEKWTIAIITGNTNVRRVLEEHELNPREVADVIERTHRSHAVVKLLSSQLDADRIDYLLRDSKMTGAEYGRFDLEWLCHVLRLGEVNGEIEVGLDMDKGQSIAEDFVMARYYMYKHVYFHKATRSAEVILASILKRAVELAGKGELELPYDLAMLLPKGREPESVPETVKHYLRLTDATILHYMSEWSLHPDPILSELCNRLMCRNLFKSVDIEEKDWFNMAIKVFSYAQKNSVPPEYFFLADEPSSSSYEDSYIVRKTEQEHDAKEKEDSEQIFLFDAKGNPKELADLSKIINQIRNTKITARRLFMPATVRDEIFGGR